MNIETMINAEEMNKLMEKYSNDNEYSLLVTGDLNDGDSTKQEVWIDDSMVSELLEYLNDELSLEWIKDTLDEIIPCCQYPAHTIEDVEPYVRHYEDFEKWDTLMEVSWIIEQVIEKEEVKEWISERAREW